MSRSRRALMGSATAVAPLLVAGVATASSVDAGLVAMAAELRATEAAYEAGVRSGDAWSGSPEGEAISVRLEELVTNMADTPAMGLAGIAAKAGRLCVSLEQGTGALMYCENVLVASLAADLARLAPQALGVQA